MKLLHASLTDTGRVREQNEDSIWVERYGNGDLLCIVADGMGGHRAGEVASRMVCREIGWFFANASPKQLSMAFDPKLSVDENMMSLALRAANRRVYQEASSIREHAGMGSTVVAAYWREAQNRNDIVEKKLVIGHAGDSRAYRARMGAPMRQLTEDHSLAAQVLKALSPEERKKVDKRDLHTNVILKAMGTAADVDPTVQSVGVRLGDTFLLCSDGLTGMVPDHQIQLIAQKKPLAEVPKRLVDAANAAGGEDNISVIAMRAT